jgi:putative flippase GtrA
MDTTTPLPTLGAQTGPGGSSVGAGPLDLSLAPPVIDVVIPVYNEERELEPAVRRLLTRRRRVDLPGLRRRRPEGSRIVREGLTFGAIGVVSTLAYAVLYLLLRGWMDAPAANAVALVVTAIGNTAANRRLTFGVRGRASMIRDQVAGLAAFAIALLLTSASIAILDRVAPDAGRGFELVVLVAANAAATVTRFVLLRSWISRAPRTAAAASGSLAARSALQPAHLERTVR